MTTEPNKIEEEEEALSFSNFLESTPPNQVSKISDLCENEYNGHYYEALLRTPEVQLHCSSDECNGPRFFRVIDSDTIKVPKESYRFVYVRYRCSNCTKISKTYSLAVSCFEGKNPEGNCFKFGEWPTFGPPTPSRLLKLIGPDRDVFLKGRRCENQGLGIGAFIYYRRVVENQKDRILDEIIKVLEKIGNKQAQIDILETAKNENQFTKALNQAKEAIPESLLIDGHNPLLLLHSALSEGVHAKSDEHCLDIAGSVRIVLGELSDRLSQALKKEAELTKALSTLMNKK